MTVSREIENEIRVLHFGEHLPIGTVASQLDLHVDVVRRVVGPRGPPRQSVERERVIDPVKDLISQTLLQYPRLRASRLFDMVVPRGYAGSLRTLREYVRTVRPKKSREAYLRLRHLPGEQGQIDWAHVGHVPVPGGQRALWMFVMSLPHSRAMWGEFVLDLSAWSLVRSLTRACEYFGGTPREWLFDNPKIVVLERHGDAARFHPLLLDLSGHYVARLKLCGVRKANEKGNVERMIRYIRDRFLAGRSIRSIEQGNREFLTFLSEIAHARPHPESHDITVAQSFEKERRHLLPLPSAPICTDQVVPVRVDKTASCRFDKNDYSVPVRCAYRTLTVAADDRLVRFLDGAEPVASHARCWGVRQCVELPEHRAELLDRKREALPAKGQDRLRLAAPGIDTLFERCIDAGRNVGAMTVKALHLLDRYGADDFAAAVGDVVERGGHDTGAIGIICERRRRLRSIPAAIDVAFSPHVADRDVVPHDLGAYDDR